MSLISKTANVNGLVAEMTAALEDKDFRNVFERPVIRTASDESEETEELSKEASATTAESLFESLLATSAHLDELGFSKSAERLLVVAQELIVEAQQLDQKPDPMPSMPGHGDAAPMPVMPGQGGGSTMPVEVKEPGKDDKLQAHDSADGQIRSFLASKGLELAELQGPMETAKGTVFVAMVSGPGDESLDALESKLDEMLPDITVHLKPVSTLL